MLNLKYIREKVRKGQYRFSRHADEERTADKLKVSDIEEAVLSGEIIEERLDDPRGPSCLIFGRNKRGEQIHVVMGFTDDNWPLIVTVYRPSEDEWIEGKVRRRK